MKYYIDDNLSPISQEQLLHELQSVSVQRKEKVLRFRYDSGRLQSLRAFQLLQKALVEEYGINEPPVFIEQENGKPVIEGHEDIHFNISHCKSGVACVVGNEPIGIDIENIPSDLKDGLLEYVFSKEEQDMVHNAKGMDKEGNSLSPTIMFARLWTMKESLVKLTGRGITGKEQLVPLLNEWHKGNSDYDFIIRQNVEKGWVCSICFRKER
ncbi:MAG: 4'-phosphopantetheinyl transferase superfamily protein [Prevotella sp.]|nr:4'-phosphopantetheinyl transferase superfamily protein [Prevotella sp.]